MSFTIDQPPPPRVKKWTKSEYMELTEHFQGQHVYLFRGELIEMSPQYHPHAFAVTELNELLHLTYGVGAGYKVRIQLPFEVPGESLPEPDALVCTQAQGVRVPHPNEGVLVIEVADSSTVTDRAKAVEYAAAQVPEYWIVDVNARQIEVYRDPIVDPVDGLGSRFQTNRTFHSTESIEPLSKPGCAIPVAQLFHVI